MKRLDIILLIVFPIISVVVSLAITANFLTSTLLFFGLPALWFSYRTPNRILRTCIFSIVFTIPLTLISDTIAVLDQSWFVPTTVFSFRLLGIIPIEDFIWGFLFIYSVIIYYEHFLDKGKHALIDQRLKYLAWPSLLTILIFFIIFFTKPEIFAVHYAYFWLGLILFLLPTITFLSFFPRLLSKYVKTGVYFFVLALLFELTGLHLQQWTFPGKNFIGWVELAGYRFPFEEFFFWFVIGAVGILSYYEFFDDDRR